MSARNATVTALWLGLALSTNGCAPSGKLPSFAVVTSGVSAPAAVPPSAASNDAAALSTLALPSYPDGARRNVGSLDGKVVLIDVWATYCAPCKESLPALQSFSEELRGQPFEVVTVNIDETAEAIAPFLASTKVSLRVLRDPGAARLSEFVRVTEAPTSILLDSRGRVRFVHPGTSAEVAAKIRDEARALLAEMASARSSQTVVPAAP